MPRRLPEKTRLQEERPRNVNTRNRPFQVTFGQKIPITEGQELEVVVDDIGRYGDRTKRIHRFSVFAPQPKIDERLKVKIAKIKRGFALAERISEMGGKN